MNRFELKASKKYEFTAIKGTEILDIFSFNGKAISGKPFSKDERIKLYESFGYTVTTK